MVTPFRRMLLGLKSLVAGRVKQPFAAQRDFARVDVNAEVTIFFQGQSLKGWLRDVSISGAMLAPADNMAVGAELELELPNIPGRVEAQVMRLTEEGAGVRFINPSIGVLIAGWSRGTSSGPGTVLSGSGER